MLGSGISLRTLSQLCRALGTMLNSGVAVHKALELSSRKVGDPKCQKILAEVTQEVQQGNDLSGAFRLHGNYFPDLFLQMTEVAEQSGALPEVLARLAEHYENLLRLRRSFMTAIAWPCIQLFLAIFVIAGLIYILGIIGDSTRAQGNQPVDMLGLGLMGASGAMTWLTLSLGTIFGLVGGYFVLARGFRQQRFADGVLMMIPVVKGCMRDFALARFAWVYSLTQQTGMPVVRSLQASLKATNNGVFMAQIPLVCGLIDTGDELSQAMRTTRLFPEEFLHMVEVAETSGTVPEMLERLSPEFEAQAQRSLAAMAAMLGWVIWMMVAALIVFIVFRIMLRYIGMINDLTNQIK